MNNLAGKPAVDFQLNDVDGNVHSLASDQGHWLLLLFHRHLG